MAREVGIPGSGPSTVTPTPEEEKDVVRQIKDADQDIQNRWFNWNFLWSEHSTNTSIGVSTISSPSDLMQWNVDAVVYSPLSSDYQPLDYVAWNSYRDNYKYGVIASGIPEAFSVKPNNVIDVYPTPDSATAMSAEYWKTPTLLSSASDVSAIPVRFHRIIICRAKIYYAEQNDAPEIMSASVAEFSDLLDKLESDQLPSQRNRRFSEVQDRFNYTVVPE
tara:strand:- start:396 stop:1055 length:660 start_codon:yes stop_codon:yes gene_type:complete